MRKETINEICLLVVENNDLAKKMIRDVQKSHQAETVVENITNKSLADRYKIHFPLRKIKEDPLFQPKRQSSALIVADFCAYVMKKSRMKDRRYDRFIGPIKKHLVVYDGPL
jgi:hypothetical protein